MRAYIDKDICIGCGLCPDICSEIYQMDDEGKAIAKNIDITDELLDDAKDAQSQCPVEAINIE